MSEVEAERAKREMEQGDETPEHTDETMSTDEKTNGETNESIETETDSDTTTSLHGWDVLHHHGNVWLVTDPDGNTYNVNLRDGDPEVRPFGVGNEHQNYGTKELSRSNAAIRAVVRNGPNDRRDPNVYHSPASASQAANGGSQGDSESADDSDEDDDPSDSDGVDTDLSTDHGYTDEDKEIMLDSVESWLDRADDFEADFHAEHMTTEFGEIEHDGEKVPGVAIRRKAPFETPFHSGDDWNDQEGWNEFKDAVKSVMKSKDAIVYKQEGYDAVNFVPAEHVEDVTG